MTHDEKPQFDPVAFFTQAAGGRSVLRYQSGQIVLSQGDPADSVFYIESGKVKITVVSEHGKEAVVAVLGPGEFFGHDSLAGQRLRWATVSTMTDCVISRIDAAEIFRVIHDEPEFAELFIAKLLTRIVRVEEDLVDQLLNPSEKRLARILLLFADFDKDSHSEPIKLKISQETLAEMVGTTRSRISFFMNKFRQLGFIDYNGHIEVHPSLMSVILD